MQQLFFVGQAYPHRSALLELQSLGYSLGIFHDATRALKNADLFSSVIELDFSSRDQFTASLNSLVELPRIDGLLCTYENYVIYKALLCQKLGLPGMDIEAAVACTDKYVMRSKFIEHDPSITPSFALVTNEATLLDFAHSHAFPLVLKPTGLVKSLLVSTCESLDELMVAYHKTIAEIDNLYQRQRVTGRRPAIIVEEFIEGRMCSVAAFIDTEGVAHLCDGIAQLTMAKDVGSHDNFLYCRRLTDTIPLATQSIIRSVASNGVKALGMTSSPAHIEIIYNEHSAKIVEIGARTGGYRPFMYGESYGINMLEQEARIAIGEYPQLESQFTKHTAIYELFAHQTAPFSHLEHFEHMSSYTYVNQVAKPGDIVGPAKDGFKASAIVGVSTPSRETFNQLCNSIEHIEVITS